jgi:hypothetical protein
MEESCLWLEVCCEKQKIFYAVGTTRTCTGRPQLISGPSNFSPAHKIGRVVSVCRTEPDTRGQLFKKQNTPFGCPLLLSLTAA